MRIHVDTDFGGDPDDACALAMLLAWPDVEIVGITTNLDVGGRRAGCVEYVLALADAHGVPVAAGAGVTLSTGQQYDSTWGEQRHWPSPIDPKPGAPGAALDLLSASIEQGASIAAIGAFTNLALLEVMRPGTLRGVTLVATAGWIGSPGDGYPSWGPEMDFNVCCDPRAAAIVFEAGCKLTLVCPTATIKAHLRGADLPRLCQAGRVGQLLAQQGVAVAAEFDNAALGRAHASLPDDLLNFHWDPVTCAIAVGWQGADVSEQRLAFDVARARFEPSDAGRLVRVVTDVDIEAFREMWLQRIGSLP